MCPEIADFWADVWTHLESRVDEREFFIEAYRYEHGESEIDTKSNRDVREPESLDELFCDECGTFQFSVAVQGDAHYCGDCWEALGMAEQAGLDAYKQEADRSGVYALVGCGADKKRGVHEAADLYASPYFTAKQRFAEAFTDAWWIISAKHGLVAPDDQIRDYDTEVREIDVGEWLDDIQAALAAYWEAPQEVWVLVGEAYVSAADAQGRTLKHVVTQAATGADVYYPFRQTSGIGDQHRWLQQCVQQETAAMPHALWDTGQQSLDAYQDATDPT